MGRPGRVPSWPASQPPRFPRWLASDPWAPFPSPRSLPLHHQNLFNQLPAQFGLPILLLLVLSHPVPTQPSPSFIPSLWAFSDCPPPGPPPARHCGGDIQECAVVPCRSSQSSRFCTWQGCQDSSPSYAAHQLCHLGFVHLGLRLLICQMGYIQSPAHR